MKMTCDFCFRRCSIPEGEHGWCRMRKCEGGRIVSEHYGEIPAIALDPVEKKPLYHFLPGTMTLSFGASGCNLSCRFCQNWQLSQKHEKGGSVDPCDAAAYAVLNGIPSVSFTYSEPLVWQDWMMETARNAAEEGIRTIMVTNGEASPEAIERLVPLISAFNIDLKGDDGFYRSICSGRIAPVLDMIGSVISHGKHAEITTMVIESIHTSRMISEMGKLLRNLGVSVWHLTRFFPQYKMNNIPPTSELYLARMLDAAKESGIPFIYPGNSTFRARTKCPSCGHILREAPGKPVGDGFCPRCGTPIYGVWE